MSIIKDYNLDHGFDDITGKSIHKTGTVIKSAFLKPIEHVVRPTELLQSSSDAEQYSDQSDIHESTFYEEHAPEPEPEPEPVVEAPPQPTIDESKIRQEIEAEVKANIDDLLGAIEGLQQSRDQVFQSAETQIVDLALLIAEKIVHKKVEMDPSIIKDVVEDTLNKISGSDRITFKINPSDVDIFTDFQPYLETRLIGVEKITIQQDPTVDQGGCIIETDLGFVDVTIKEKLNIISQTFKKVKATL